MLDTIPNRQYMPAHQAPIRGNDPDDGAWPWFVVSTEPCAERQAKERIDEIGGVTTWLLLEVRTRTKIRHGRPVFVGRCRQREEVLRPFFPGYLLVSFDPDGDAYAPLLRWNPKLRTRYLICDDAYHPIPLPQKAVQGLRGQGRASDGAIDVDRLPARLSPGNEVRVLDGPFADRRAVVGWTDQRRVEVLLGALKVNLDRSQVERV